MLSRRYCGVLYCIVLDTNSFFFFIIHEYITKSYALHQMTGVEIV